MKYKDLCDKKFGRLTPIKFSGPDKRSRSSLWLCKCDCGNEIITRRSRLINRETTSCGCLRIKHGHNMNNKSSTYNSWASMKQRCKNKNIREYNYYGGRGIKVCDRWLKFENFLEDMGEKPEIHLELDRINNDGNYEPGNCRWTTRSEQNRNRRKYTHKRKKVYTGDKNDSNSIG